VQVEGNALNLNTEITNMVKPDVDVVVVGAGFAGLYAVHKLTRAGLQVQGLEAGDGPGGTWYWNRYPGARTDSRSHIYSYTFSDELRDEWDWSERYAGQAEVLAYLEHVADKVDLRRHFRFGERVDSASYDEETNLWTITTHKGYQITATYLVTGVGNLSAVNWPNIDGISDFKGTLLHTARWPHEGSDLTGKRVAVIGSGSSGVQFLPEAAKLAKEVTLFQRTPNYVMPSQNRELTTDEQSHFRDNHIQISDHVRQHPYSHAYEPVGDSAKAAPIEERERVFEEAWNDGGFALLMSTYADLGMDLESNALVSDFIRNKIRNTVKDPAIADVLSPKDYPFAAKRPPAGTGYYETFNLPHVKLIDVKTTPIDRITPTGVVVADHEYLCDVLVIATGFDASTGALLRMGISGRDGVRLQDAWKDGPRTYLGLTAPQFPNMFMILGPQAPFSNAPTCIEENVNWIEKAIRFAQDEGAAAVEPSDDSADQWSAECQVAGDASLARYGAQANSWMSGANIEGKPQAYVVYFGGANVYFDRCDAVAEMGYPGLEFKTEQELARVPR
jgi:cation diffusion facilitator CzcD-associated flavoprotein CzcO